jgi:hypothetical protein
LIDPRLPQAPESPAVSGTYAINADGTGNLGPNTIAVIAPGQGNLYYIEESAGNTNPAIFMVEGIESQYPITPQLCA